MTKLLHADITDKALRAYYNVYNAHGHDYPEAFYEKMMALEFAALNVRYATQVAYQIFYKGKLIGKHISDSELAERVILEYKVSPHLIARNEAQLISNLKVSGKEVGLLLNFGSEKPEQVRRILTAEYRMPQALWHPDSPDAHSPAPLLTQPVRQVVWTVFNELGVGYAQRIYFNALRVELGLSDIVFHYFRRMVVEHRGQEIGSIPFNHFLVAQQFVLVPVVMATISQAIWNKTKAAMRRYGVKFAMIVNFENEMLTVRYVR